MKTIGINLKDEMDPAGIMNAIEIIMRDYFPQVEYELYRQEHIK